MPAEPPTPSLEAMSKKAMRLANRVVPAGSVREEAEKLARRIASRAPLPVQLHKTMIDRGQEASLETMLNFETEDYGWATTELMAVADDCCGGKVVSTLEGGYDLIALAASAAAHVRALMG